MLVILQFSMEEADRINFQLFRYRDPAPDGSINILKTFKSWLKNRPTERDYEKKLLELHLETLKDICECVYISIRRCHVRHIKTLIKTRTKSIGVLHILNLSIPQFVRVMITFPNAHERIENLRSLKTFILDGKFREADFAKYIDDAPTILILDLVKCVFVALNQYCEHDMVKYFVRNINSSLLLAILNLSLYEFETIHPDDPIDECVDDGYSSKDESVRELADSMNALSVLFDHLRSI